MGPINDWDKYVVKFEYQLIECLNLTTESITLCIYESQLEPVH